MKALIEMTLEELDQAKYALEKQMQALREKKRSLPEDHREREQKVNQINEDLSVLRMRKLDIQDEQDRRAQPIDPTAHTISGAGGVQSQEKFGTIGGKSAKKK